jgi:uncharacterized protein (DUF427 family)
MPSHITITPAPGRWQARAGDLILADTTAALELREGASPPVIYFPRADAALGRMTRATRTTGCPWKGTANYFSVPGLGDAVWTYEAPKPDVSAIMGHLAFYPDRVTVVRVTP